MIDVWNTGFALELVRFAGRNRLCLELAYGGTTRLVEPYSLRHSQAGDLLFYAWEVVHGEIRSYRVDRIQSVRVTHRPFLPRFHIEF